MHGNVQGNVSAHKSSESPATKNSCGLQMSEPRAFSLSLFCPCVKHCNWIYFCLASKTTHLTCRGPGPARYLRRNAVYQHPVVFHLTEAQAGLFLALLALLLALGVLPCPH